MSDGENLLQTVKTVIQDVVAPDVRELKVKLDGLDKRIDSVETNLEKRISSVETNLEKRISSVEANLGKRIDSVEASVQSVRDQLTTMERHMTEQNASQLNAILAAIGQSKAETELIVFKQVSAIAERLSAVEARLLRVESLAA